MKRWIFIVAVLLLLGAIVNVAVAWMACALVERWSDQLDCMLELSMFDDSCPKSRYEEAGVCVDHNACRSRLTFAYSEYQGGWRNVPDLDAEVPVWADAYLSDEALARLRGHEAHERLMEAAGWPLLSMSGCVEIGSAMKRATTRSNWAIVLPHRTKPWTGYSGS